jgi:hypothetical protein
MVYLFLKNNFIGSASHFRGKQKPSWGFMVSRSMSANKARLMAPLSLPVRSNRPWRPQTASKIVARHARDWLSATFSASRDTRFRLSAYNTAEKPSCGQRGGVGYVSEKYLQVKDHAAKRAQLWVNKMQNLHGTRVYDYLRVPTRRRPPTHRFLSPSPLHRFGH